MKIVVVLLEIDILSFNIRVYTCYRLKCFRPKRFYYYDYYYYYLAIKAHAGSSWLENKMEAPYYSDSRNLKAGKKERKKERKKTYFFQTKKKIKRGDLRAGLVEPPKRRHRFQSV